RRDYELLQTSYQGLYELHGNERRLLNGLEARANRGMIRQSELVQLQGVRSEQVRDTESLILLLEELIDSQRMESMARTLEELSNVRNQLRDMLEEYAETQDPQLRAEIERELQRLESRMRELLQRLSEQMQNLPSEHYNMEALEEMGMLADAQDMSSALEQIRERLDSGDIEGALEALENLGAQVDSMMQQLSESQSSGGGGVSELDRQLAEVMDQINDLEAQEREIEEETAALQEEIRERRVEALEQQLDDLLGQAHERIQRMDEQLQRAEDPLLRQDLQEDLSAARERLAEVAESLQAEDIAQALEDTEALMQELGNTSYRLAGSSQRSSPSQRGRAYAEAEEGTQQAFGEARELARELENIMDQARPTPGPQDSSRLQQLAEMQERTGENLQQLRQQVQEMGEGMPMIEEQLGPALEGVQGQMQGARQGLQQGQMPGALESERQALQGLGQMREQIGQMVARERMGQRQSGSTSRERVEIAEETGVGAEEFREDILDAMRENSLAPYEEAIRTYYESLVE
ncbi:MAG: hypothetical protein KC561_15625, partial [Myxococcales bacterium]|nr:hypothetical protein [Myxococcales bacterium]